MILSYWKAAIRFFKKNWPLTTLNIVFFGIGLAACLLILDKVGYEFSYDKFYDNYENIYRVSLDHYYPHDAYQNSTAQSFYPIGTELKNQYPEVKQATRVSNKRRNSIIRIGDKAFQEDDVYIVNPSFFDIFSVDMIYGDTVDIGMYDVFLSEDLAIKLFGETNVVGSSIDMWDGNLFKVKGVYKDVPQNSHFHYNLLLTVHHDRDRMTDWQYYSLFTYIALEDGVHGSDFEKKLAPFNEKFSKISDEQSDVNYRWEIKLQPLSSIYLESDLELEHEINGDLQSVYLLSLMAFLIVVISCFNFVNLSSSMYAKRIMEFYIRKVHGATKGNLVKQYAFEALILLVAGIVIATVILVLLPYFSDYSVDLGSRSQLFYQGLLGIVITMFLLSVILPAAAFSFINPLKFANGEFVSNPLTKGLGKSLIVAQFIMSFILLAGSITISRQLDFITYKSPGINVTDVVTLDFPSLYYPLNAGDFNKLKVDLEKLADIKSVSFSQSVPGTKHTLDGSFRLVDDPNERANVNYLQLVSSEYFSTYEMEILAGRVFDERRPADSASILINESMAKALILGDYGELIGKEVVMPWNRGYPTFEIVGVVKDYYHESLKNPIVPCAFIPITFAGICNNASIRLRNTNNQNWQESIAVIEEKFSNIFPHVFKLKHVEDNYSGSLNSYFELATLIKALALLAILLAGVGLFGLASLETAKRTKEVAIRKVIGAQSKDIYMLYLKFFAKLIGVAFLISLPVSFYFANDWLNNFAVRIGMGFWFFGLQILITAVIALLAISYSLIKANLQNPVVALRNNE